MKDRLKPHKFDFKSAAVPNLILNFLKSKIRSKQSTMILSYFEPSLMSTVLDDSDPPFFPAARNSNPERRT